jgi:hypothetical protein
MLVHPSKLLKKPAKQQVAQEEGLLTQQQCVEQLAVGPVPYDLNRRQAGCRGFDTGCAMRACRTKGESRCRSEGSE